MDPQACLHEMFDAIRDGDIETAQDLLFGLATWIGKGGFCPLVTPAMVEKILEARREMTDDA